MTTPQFDTIVCLDDLLRPEMWPAKEFMYDLLRVPVFAACGLNIGKGVRIGQQHNLLPGFEPERFMALCHPGGPEAAWVKFFHAIPAKASAYLRQYLPPKALVLSYEMPPWLQAVLDETGTQWIDLRISPLRFASDLYIGLRASNQRLYTAAHARSVSMNEVTAEAALLAARLRYRLRYEKVAGTLEQQCVYIGQTEFDASLLAADGRYVRASDYADTLRKLAASGALHYKPHPLAGDFAARERAALEDITGTKVLLCEVGTYELLAREENVMLVGLSSGVLQEAVWFGREAYALFQPICQPRFDAEQGAEGYLQIAAHEFMSQPLWSALLDSPGQQPPLQLPARANHLRELHDTWWGYGSAVLRHNAFQREAYAAVGGLRQAEALRRCEADLAATRAEVTALKLQLASSAQPAAAAASPSTTQAPNSAHNAASHAINDARIDTLRMEMEGVKEALRLLARQAALQAERETA